MPDSHESQPTTACAGSLLVRRCKRQPTYFHSIEQPSQHVGDLGDSPPECLGVIVADLGDCHTGLFENGVEIGQLGSYPGERLGRQPVDELAGTGIHPEKTG
jgi:hypothetical protein